MKVLALMLFLGAVLSPAFAQTEEFPVEEEGSPAEEEEELFKTPAAKMAAAATNFGFNLYRQLAYKDLSSNVFLSPPSVAAALSQLSLGCSPSTEKQLYKVLQYHLLQEPELHTTLKNLLSAISDPGKGFKTAARIYLERKLRVKLDYLNTVEKEYGVRPKVLVGNPRVDLKDVNDWVRQQTGGKIDRFLSANLPRNIGVLPLGAAYFKGQWVNRFSQGGRPQNFKVDDLRSVSVPMMSEERYPVKLGIESNLRCKIAQVPMQGDVSMLLFLPDEVSQNLTQIEESLNAEFIHDIVTLLQPVDVSLTLPALKLSYTTNLLPTLADLGLQQFISTPELVKITSQQAKVNSLHHKVALEVTEEGAQPLSNMARGLYMAFHVDRPFIFVVREETSGTTLFIGRVMNPSKFQSL
ncbi:pigment epithelium-derived factor [Erpetoichthys calabaricus]|uniref:pigment epithelium-derived factor n=1 Tax=Erpetoichthys calabaricus TaxID=27687 RepID=UPI00223450DA|nr:pigment epithelium-derived factor [Erpetoichthys calabaricus]